MTSTEPKWFDLWKQIIVFNGKDNFLKMSNCYYFKWCYENYVRIKKPYKLKERGLKDFWALFYLPGKDKDRNKEIVKQFVSSLPGWDFSTEELDLFISRTKRRERDHTDDDLKEYEKAKVEFDQKELKVQEPCQLELNQPLEEPVSTTLLSGLTLEQHELREHNEKTQPSKKIKYVHNLSPQRKSIIYHTALLEEHKRDEWHQFVDGLENTNSSRELGLDAVKNLSFVNTN